MAWRLSNTLDGSFCLEMLEEALSKGRPEVFTTDQGVQFTAPAWTGRLESAGVAVSMDGKGRQHQALGYRTPAQVYQQGRKNALGQGREEQRLGSKLHR